jgi:predicted nucleic acid-binding protein
VTRKRRASSAQPAVIDACCLIDLLASGHMEAILRAAGFDWQLPSAVQGEVQHVRQHDPAQPGQFLKVAVDLSSVIASGVLHVCGPADQTEQDGFVHYAAQFRSDGEAMCIALAEQRGWALATDDRKAIRVAQQAGLTVVSCPVLLKRWADAMKPDQATLWKVLLDIQVLAQFKPSPAMPEYRWWVDELAKSP